MQVPIGVELRRYAAIVEKDIRQYYSKAPTLSWGILFPLTLTLLLLVNASGWGLSRIVPGLLGVTVMFAATTMSQVAVSFDEMNGGLARIAYSPVRPLTVYAAKLTGGFALSLADLALSIAAVRLAGVSAPLIHPWWLAASLVLGSLLFSALGVLVSSILEPVSAVAALNAARFTLLFLGGALIPKILLPRLLRLVAEALPLIYLVEGFRYGLYNTTELLPPGAAMLVLAGYTFLLLSAGYTALERRLEEA